MELHVVRVFPPFRVESGCSCLLHFLAYFSGLQWDKNQDPVCKAMASQRYPAQWREVSFRPFDYFRTNEMDSIRLISHYSDAGASFNLLCHQPWPICAKLTFSPWHQAGLNGSGTRELSHCIFLGKTNLPIFDVNA